MLATLNHTSKPRGMPIDLLHELLQKILGKPFLKLHCEAKIARDNTPEMGQTIFDKTIWVKQFRAKPFEQDHFGQNHFGQNHYGQKHFPALLPPNDSVPLLGAILLRSGQGIKRLTVLSGGVLILKAESFRCRQGRRFKRRQSCA